MRGIRAKKERREPTALNPNRVIARITIVALADGQVSIRNLPDNERVARAIMTRAVQRMAEYFESKHGDTAQNTDRR